MTVQINDLQEMVADNDTLIITDPCYLIREEHWEHYCNMEFGPNPIGLDNYLRQYHNFGEVIAMETGYGDWTNQVYNVRTGKIIGDFTADAGMVICATASDLSNYGVTPDQIKDYEDRGCLAIIPNFTGHIVGAMQEEDNQRVALIYGTSDDEDFGFSTLKLHDTLNVEISEV